MLPQSKQTATTQQSLFLTSCRTPAKEDGDDCRLRRRNVVLLVDHWDLGGCMGISKTRQNFLVAEATLGERHISIILCVFHRRYF